MNANSIGAGKRVPLKLGIATLGLVALGVVMAKSSDDGPRALVSNPSTVEARSPTAADTQRPPTISEPVALLDDTADLAPAPSPQALSTPSASYDPTDITGGERAEQATEPKLTWQTATVRSGDSLSLVGARHGVGASVIYKLMASGTETKHLKRIKPGEQIELAFNADKQLQTLRYRVDEATQLLIHRTPELNFVSELEIETLERRTHRAQGTVKNSLFLAATAANLPQSLIMELAGIFGWDIDFALDVRGGDRFSVVYEAFYRDGERVRIGRILSAEYVNQGRPHRAAWYQPDGGRGDYYAPDGRTLRKAFLRNPVDIVRITSGFNLRRKHPILHKIRAHKGVDYGAPTGTPIRATGDGKIIHRGRKGGYGKTVVLRHGSKYSSLYAHLSAYARGQKSGSRVKQGQIIGYVGATGRVTGAHLHYEFRVNGVHRNPLKVKFPGVAPIPKAQREDFESQTKPLFAELDTMYDRQLASHP